MREISVVAIVTGMLLSIVLGAANAYLGLKAGLTVAATFPAAVIAMAVLRMTKGTILEENVCRTTAAVGEALAAGAIFTVPAFLISGAWTGLRYTETTLLLLLGGVLGVLFVIFLRRVLIEDTTLPFPESVACAEIVKAGQGGQTGAAYVFGALGLSAALQFIKADQGLKLLSESWATFVPFMKSKAQLLVGGNPLGDAAAHQGGVYIQSPVASPALMSVGYIIGPRLSAVVFAGGVLAWYLFVPLLLFIAPALANNIGLPVPQPGGKPPVPASWSHISGGVWFSYVRPLAVGAMIVGAFFTLFKMRSALIAGIGRAIKDMRKVAGTGTGPVNRLDQDLPLKWVAIAIVVLVIPIAVIYYRFCDSVVGAVVAAVVMTVAGFLFAAVAGFLVGTIGSSNNPISGLTLSTLIIAALLMVAVGVKGMLGVAAVLGVATVVCCSSGVAGDIMQDLKVGHFLGGTPWKMEVGVIFGVVAASLVMVFPLMWLHEGTPGGIGGPQLAAPQAGLMAMLSKGIVGGEMAWPLVIVGACFSIAMILIKAPSPMLIAVGMYLPFDSSFAIFVGGVIRWISDLLVARRKLDAQKVENTGTLLASGLIAGEALVGILLAILAVGRISLPKIYEGAWPAILIFVLIGFVLVKLPIGSVNAASGSGEKK
ncbi:MAG: oligopeptide transporter, OPT family [Deltaproteobacteria bacterium]|nr:oligopeptide transporter, OPT family [Deltaproteobacteria bacterium]